MTSNANQIVYGRTAYEGFAKAIGSKLGLNVKVTDGASACIDAGGVIQMPGMSTHQTADQFAVTCGVIIHELAHQFYKSHALIDPSRERLEHDCLNAVLDVADETWIDEWFIRQQNTRPGLLLAGCNDDAFRKNAANGSLADWANPATHAWKVLCMGILIARKVRIRSGWKRHTVDNAYMHSVDAKACFRLIRKAARLKNQDPAPTKSRFAKLLKLAKQLADLLKPFTPPAGAPASPSLIPLDAALGQGQQGQPATGKTPATAQQGADLANGVGAGLGDADNSSDIEFDADAFNLLAPAVAKVAHRIAIDGESLDTHDGLTSGSRLGQAHRLITDGQCLARWNDNDHADGVSVSVLLDCSSSMGYQLPTVAGIARAFAVSMRQAGAVQTLAFGCHVKESSDFARVEDMGGTGTDKALLRATCWLATRPGQRWIVLITDGCPNNPRATDDACLAAAALGIRILAVGLQCSIKMATATVVTAKTPAHLAIELDAAAQQIEQPVG